MYPELARLGPITIHTFGVMMALAFVSAGLVTAYGLRKRGFNPELTYSLLIAAVVGGVLGAKIHFLILNPEFFPGNAFSGNGLVWYGGLLGGAVAVWLVSYFSRPPTAEIADAIAPGLALAYAVGRVGCLLRGDDYGVPSDLPWAMSFPQGLPPTTAQVHPTQIYESLASLVILGLLVWVLAPRLKRAGSLFWSYVILAGIERFLVEFVRTNEPGALGLTHAQWLSVFLFLAGVIGVWWLEVHGGGRRSLLVARPRIPALKAGGGVSGQAGVARSGRSSSSTHAPRPGQSKKARQRKGRR